MLSKIIARGFITASVLAIGAAAVHAQQPGGTYPGASSPTVSPYLMLLPQQSSVGAIPAAPGTYQAIVRPAIQARDLARQTSVQNQPYVPGQAGTTPTARNPQTTGVDPSVRATGHSATYRNYSHYFPSLKK